MSYTPYAARRAMLSTIEPAASRGAQPFSARHERFCDGLTPGDWDEFSGSADDEQRVRFVYERMYGDRDHGETTDDADDGKNGAETLALKGSGTECFQKSDYRQALDWYSRAVLRCPQTKEWLPQLSIIYANRSACLYHLGDYDLAVADIQQALDNGYPKDLRYKIYDRRAKCFLATKQLKSAIESFKTTVRALDDSKLSQNERRKRQMDVEATLSTIMAKDGKNVRNESVVKSSNRSWPKLYGEPSESHPAASDAVSVVHDEAVGRHAIARRDVPVGRVLLVERAYASVLLQEYSHSHCTHCFVKLVAPLPCPDCDKVAFCGEPCKRTALRSYHAIECPFLPALYATGVSITCLMALRIITQRPLKYFVDLRPKLNRTYMSSGKHEPENYLNLYNLVTHRETRSTRDVLHRSHLAAFYLSCLKKTNYFPPAVDRGQLTDDESFVGSLLLHHLMLLQFNSFEVSELRRYGDEEQTVFIGGSVYPTLAMLNHSCDPCIVRYHRGTTVIVHNVRDLKAGEAITENYGPTFTLHPREDRQQTLKTRYWFECSCIACSQDWPTWEQMQTNTSLRVRCKNCQNAITVNMESMAFTVNCKVCSKTTNLLAALKVLQDTDDKYMVAKQLMDKNDYEKALPEFMALLSLLHKHLVPPFKDYHLCQQAIGRCILSLGNAF